VNVSATIDKTSSDVIAALGFTDEMRILRQRIAAWVESCDLEMRRRWSGNSSPDRSIFGP